MTQTLRDKMFAQLQEKSLFEQAKAYAFDYLDKALERNVYPSEQAIENLKYFTEALPEENTDPEHILKQLNDYGSPATVSQIGGRYFGLVNGGILPVSLATKWLTDTWDQNTPLYVTSPITSTLEEICEDWLRELLELPTNTIAGFVSGSSMSILCSLAAARYRIFQNAGWDINKKGYSGAPAIRIITSRQTHGTVVKAIALLGFGIDNIEWVDADEQGRIIVDQVPELDSSCIVILQAGNVNSGAFDRFNSICEQAARVNAWVHIDGAFGLWAAASNKLKHLTKGIHKAHSWSVDAHKTLNTPYDSGIVLCRDKEALIHALQASGSYIVYSENRDGMLYTPEMSRRARAVELWASLKFLGKSGVEELVDGLHKRALELSIELKRQGFTIHNQVVYNQILVSADDDESTQATLLNIQRSGECWVGGCGLARQGGDSGQCLLMGNNPGRYSAHCGCFCYCKRPCSRRFTVKTPKSAGCYKSKLITLRATLPVSISS